MKDGAGGWLATPATPRPTEAGQGTPPSGALALVGAGTTESTPP